ncbi:hypothetical protein E8E13_006487 [Curvularia kusanoi]|uniref:SWI-SNF chromatin-remodeling complex protein n=1 Tax=Curvularia kusanoi TaxID=90978 RepID=A0A9P4W3Y0_CURKU|nr:hypothetical protein E8E13_006487 [Curvularia kusanoi]
MSGPFRFNQQPSAQSPLERVASPLSAGQPVSYKTNVNRAKTKKWVEAKKNAYDGDDWGDYDEYDEYGVDTTPPPEPAAAANPRYYGQRPVYDTPTRSFTDPAQQLPLPKARRNSFDAGEEQRSFSAAVPQAQQQPSPLQTSGMGREIADISPQNQQFSPSATAQPLQSHVPAGLADTPSSPPNSQFPPRKSSIGQGSAPPGPIDFIPIATSPRDHNGNQDKPLPFIRPADIYKRVEEERRRESIESQTRPSLDSLSARPNDEPLSPVGERRNLQPLETVAERKSEYLGDVNVLAQQQDDKGNQQQPQHGRVPSALKGISTFDNDFWSSGPDLQPASHAPVVSPTQDQGLRSVVDQAFTRSDDQRSVPPTPISKDSDSDLNRSNTGSTSGISPIMSRVPSSATAALKNRGLGDGSTPAIAEEPHEAGTSVSRPTSSHLGQGPQLSQGHTRNVSSTSLPRSGLATPTRGDSPARSPVFGPQKHLPEPETAQIATDSPDSTDAMAGGLSGPQAAYATREADIANAMLKNPAQAAPELGAAEKQSQDAFLESHKAQSPISDAMPRDRSESPSKGRVQALAGKFGDVSHSRRGSTQSNVSRNSVQSWERSRDHSRTPSPSKGSPGKPGSPKKEFRPHLPGGWESYAITTPAPLDRTESDKGLSLGKDVASSAPTQVSSAGQAEQGLRRSIDHNDNSSALGEVDLMPTTKKHQATEVQQPTSDPISALRYAGAAMTDSLRTTVGLGGSPHTGQEQDRKPYGDVYMPRPLHMDRTESTASSIPPTPPEKDTPTSEFPPTPPLKPHTPDTVLRSERPPVTAQLSTYPSADDQESDRLRKEIVASLSPLRMSVVPSSEPDHNSLRPGSKDADRASSILDSYYAELEKDSPRTSNDITRDIPELAPLKSVSSAQSASPQKPAALKRFSWEANDSQATTSEKQAAAVPEPTKAVQPEEHTPATIERAVEEEQQQWNEGIPEDPYFGPGHTFTVTKPEPMKDIDLAVQTPTPPLDTGASLASPPTREQTRSPGLHIVNSAQDPEAVDLPPRWSAEHAPEPPKAVVDEAKGITPPSPQPKEEQDVNPAISANTALTGSIEAPAPSAIHDSELKSPTSPTSPTDRPLGAREIATIGSAAERIATYNKTREQWANTNHGLSDWVAAVFESDPSLATQSTQAPPLQQRPQSGVFRHKHTASLAMLGKFTSSGNNQSSAAANEQYNSAGAQVPVLSSSPTTGPSKTGSGFLGRTGSHSIQTQQMQAKGKDLLHTAGVLSGKGPGAPSRSFQRARVGVDPRRGRDPDDTSSYDFGRYRGAKETAPFLVAVPSFEVATEVSIQDNSVPPVPPIPAGISGEKRGRRSRSWGNASLMRQPPERQKTSTEKSSRSLGASPVVPQFDIRDKTRGTAPAAEAIEALSQVPWNGDEPGRNESSSAMHSSPVTRGLWMSEPSLKLSERTPTETSESTDDRIRQTVLPKDTDGTLAPADLVHYDAGFNAEAPTMSTQLRERSNAFWPSKLDTTGHLGKREQFVPASEEAPVPPEFFMQLSDDISPLLHSSRASIQMVSDDEDGGLSPILIGNTSTYVADVSSEYPSPPKDLSSRQTNYETETVGAGDVSPTNEYADASVERASIRAFDMQSALESKVVGAGDVSPVSIRSSILVAASPRQPQHELRNDQIATYAANSQAERLHSADAPSDPETLGSEPSQPDNDQVAMERPRIERFKTAQEEQGPIASELTIRSIRQPASRYAAVLASEPVVSYKEYTGSSSDSSDNVLEVIKPQASSGALTPQRAELAPERADGGPMATRRVRSALQVVHAVEEYAASNSSFASTDQDSISVDASTEPDAAVQMRDESDLVTPVAQPPRNTDHHEQQADQAGTHNDTVSHAPSNGYFNDQLPAMAVHNTREDTSAAPNMTSPERSKSLLSIISSAVSSVPISPASSNAGRSTPSTIHRMQRDFSNAKRTNLTDTKIVEEPTSAKDEQTPTARNEDYDLYADHNGLVKDIRDDNGQPLRVASPAAAATAAPAELARTVTTASSIGTAPDIHDSPGRRYSFERPMSFVSGSHDDDGRPQDQINQPGSRGAPTPHQKNRSQQYPRAASGAVYSTFEPVQDTHWPPGEVVSQPTAQSIQQSVHEPVHAKVARHPTRFVPQMHVDEDDSDDTPAPQAAKTQSHQKPTSFSTAQPLTHGMPSPNGRPDANNIQDGRTSHTQHRSVSAPLQQLTLPSQETRVVSQPLSMPPSEPPAAPRNDFEYQQQMMHLQAKYPRFRSSESQALVQQPGRTQQGSHSPEKPSTKPRLAAAIKGIVGRASPNVPVANNAPPAPSTLAPTAPSHDPARAESFVSAVSSSSHEPNGSAPGGQSSFATAPQRPPSRGADSQYSHVSYGSTQVQPAQSRQNLLAPVVPAGNRNLHPHQESVQQSHLAPPQQNGQNQSFRASTGTMADVGKKKRFSAITGLFSKSNPAAELQGKFKLSREEKKAQKAQKHASQPILQSPPTQQWPPPNTQFISPQRIDDPQSQRFPQATQFAHPVNPAGAGFASSGGAPQTHPHGILGAQLPPGPAQVQQRMHQDQQTQQQRPQDEGSAYLRTRQMAEEYRARQAADQPPRPVYEDPASVGSGQRQSNEQFHQATPQSQQQRSLPPSNGYYFPDKHPQDQGAYVSSREEHQRVLQMRQQQQLEAERRRNADLPHSPGEQARQQHQRVASAEHGAYGASQIARQQALHRQQNHGLEQGAYGATQEEKQRLQQAGHAPLPGPEAFGRSQIHYDQIQHHEPPQRTAIPLLHGRQQPMSNQLQSAMTREEYTRHAQEELARHRWQQQQMQLHQFHLQQQAQLAQQQAANRSVSGPLLSQASPPASPVAQRHVSSPEPQYETPPIPEAYGHVQGVFVSPFDQSHAHTKAHGQASRQEPHRTESDVSMQPISPQVSEQSQMPSNMRHHSDASSVSVISPISGPNPEPPVAGAAVDQRPQKPRMPSISEVHQQAPPVQDLPWHMNFPAGTTEQDIVRARQKQFLQQQFASQQQAQAERHASSPSPRVSPDKQSPPFSAPLQQPQEQGGGFREVLPRQSPQPYPAPQSAPLDRRSPHQVPTHPHGATGRPTHSPIGHESSAHSPAGSQLLMQEPHTPRHVEEANQRPPYAQEQQHTAWNDRSNHESRRVPPPEQQDLYDENVPDEAPPSYDGPGVPHDGMEKSNPERPRPPNIITTPTDHGQTQDGRPRQASVGLMQHPQPASMAASPQRTAPDMGAESLRRQMLQQEEHARMERIQRSQMQALQRQREQQEREIARARAQELERSVSGGGRVGSLRSVSGSRNGGTPGWERRGPQSGSRPIFELPALEDDEPVMRATSFPGQEWVPPMYGED